jgi:arylsulfatase A-like enzyme
MLVVCLGQRAVAEPPASGRPNIVFVLTDDQGYGDLSCHGNPVLKTPHIDRLHDESARFTDFHVSPTCSPTRSALMTGRHEFRNGVTHTILERERLTLKATTIAQVLKTAGYTTGIFGKWHLGDEAAYQPNRRGFDEVFIHGAGGIGQTYAGSCGDAPGNTYFSPVILHNGTFEKTNGYCTDVFFGRALQWMETVKGKQPFFCYIPTNAPHAPLQVPDEYARKYAGKTTEQAARFFGMIANIDDNVGRLLARLKEWGIERDTLVIFMNDNGGTAGVTVHNAGMRGAKNTPWLGGTRASSFWRWPGRFTPADVDRLAAHVDFFPTIAEIAGAKLADDVKAQVEGRSLVPLLDNPRADWPDRTLFTHIGRWPKGAHREDFKYAQCSVRTTRWHLVCDSRDGKKSWQLFDVKADPGETTDLRAQHPNVVVDMDAAYDRWWASVQPQLVNEQAVGPAINPFKELYWKQYGGPGPNNVPPPQKASSGAAVRAGEKLNVVVILIDDLGRNDLGCYGSTYFRTPNLDRFAQQGLKCSDAYAACPVCSPTRASLLTGKYGARLGITDWLPGRPDRPDQKMLRPPLRQELPLEEITLARALKAAGYATGHIGKWHLGGVGFEPQKHGFDLNIAGDHTGTALSYFAPFKNAQGRFMPGLEQAPAGEYLTDRLTTEAERFIETNKDRPFFLYLAHYAVHTPLRAKPEILARYKNENRPGQQSNPIYAAMIESMDESVGRVLKKLDDLALAERTLVLFTSDNGGLCTLEGMPAAPTSNAPLREGKGFLYEGGIRVPLLVRWPGVIKPGRVDATPVCSIDFFPTILEACGIASTAKVDGVSLVKMLGDSGTIERDALYWHYPHYSNQNSRPGGAVRAGNYKLIEFYEQGRLELFDVKNDVSESRNLVEDKPELARDLHARLVAWRKEVGARMMKPNPDYVPNPQAANGMITLPARTADVHGLQLRYEPMPHKNTLGFWTRREDWASWDFQVTKPGSFKVEMLQGCGKGSGGSEVEFSVAGQTLKVVVEDTGHFQNFKARPVGTVKLEASGRYTLSVKPRTKPGVAVMDLRSITLKPADETK